MNTLGTYSGRAVFKKLLIGCMIFLATQAAAMANLQYSAKSAIIDAETTPMTSVVAHEVNAQLLLYGGADKVVRFNTYYRAWNTNETWKKIQSAYRPITSFSSAYDTTMITGLQSTHLYQLRTEIEFAERSNNTYSTFATYPIISENDYYQFWAAQWKFVNEYPTKARFDSITFNSTIFTPVHNPKYYQNRTNWTVPDEEYTMFVSYDYTENVRFGQEKTVESRVGRNLSQPIGMAVYDSIRISGLTMNQQYMLTPILIVRNKSGQQVARFNGGKSWIMTGIPTGVRNQDSSGHIVTSSVGASRARVEYGLIRPVPEARALYERVFSEEPLLKVSEVKHHLIDTGSYTFDFSKNGTSNFNFRDGKYPHHPGMLMAFRASVRENSADSSIYYSWDPSYPGIERNSTYTLVSQLPLTDSGHVYLNPAVQKPVTYRDTIILSGTVYHGKINDSKDVFFYWGKDSANLSLIKTEKIRYFTKFQHGFKPPVSLVTTTAIDQTKYRPLTKYYYGVLGDHEKGQPKQVFSITTASNAEVTGENVEMADDGSLIPTFSASVTVNDLGGTLWFEYGETSSYGQRTGNISVPMAVKFADPRTFMIQGAKLEPHKIYHFRAVLHDSAMKQTYYTQDYEFLSTFDATLGTKWFVQGMHSVFNTFGVPADLEPAIKKMTFTALDSNNNVIESKGGDIHNGAWRATFDMGKLQPKTTLHLEGFNAANTKILDMTAARFGILKDPQWLPEKADVRVDRATKTIYYTPTAHIPFPALERTFSSDLKFLANQTNSIANIFMPLEVEYDIATHKSSVTGPSLNFDAKAATKDLPITVSLFGNAYVDDEFGLDVELGGNITGPTLPILAATGKFSFEDGLVEGELNCGISCTPVFDFDFLIGNPNMAYPGPGLIRSGEKSSYIDAGLDFFGGVTGSLSVAKGVGEVSASLGLDLPVLIGVAFAQLPQDYASFIWGGDMSLKGEMEVKVAGIKVFKAHKTFYSQKWGTIPSMHKRKDDDTPSIYNMMYPGSYKGDNILSDRRNGHPERVPVYSVPLTHPMPSIAHRDSSLAVTWLDDIGTHNRLWLNTIRYKDGATSNSFDTPVLIAENRHGMSHPQSVLLKNGSAFTVWTQTRYNKGEAVTATMHDLFRSQDIWGSYYDASLKTVSAPFRFSDDDFMHTSGRMEGKPQIAAISDSSILATWIAGDAFGRKTLPHYSFITLKNGAIEHTEPIHIADMHGSARNVHVAAAGDGKAVAVWLNNDNMDTEDPDNRLMTAFWNGEAWTTQTLVEMQNRVHITDLDLKFDNGKGLLVVTSLTEDTLKGNSHSELAVYEWNSTANTWNALKESVLKDSVHFLKMPELSISTKGIAAITVNREKMYRMEDKTPHLGDLDMFFKNINAPGTWKHEDRNPFAMDTNFFEWEVETGFASGNTMFILTQENQLISNGFATLINGVRFGKPEQEMVLRAVLVNDNLVVGDATEPQGTILSAEDNYSAESERVSISEVQLYPNPATDRAAISFSTNQFGKATLELYNTLGIKVATLMEREIAPGTHSAEFILPEIANGVYNCVLTINGRTAMQQLTIVK
jgi:hypothetical protein